MPDSTINLDGFDLEARDDTEQILIDLIHQYSDNTERVQRLWERLEKHRNPTAIGRRWDHLLPWQLRDGTPDPSFFELTPTEKKHEVEEAMREVQAIKRHGIEDPHLDAVEDALRDWDNPLESDPDEDAAPDSGAPETSQELPASDEATETERSRATSIGQALIEKEKTRSDFNSKTQLKRWAGKQIGYAESTAYEAIVAVGCWRTKRQGSSEGLDEIIDCLKRYASTSP
jgi:hypothetical protein